MHATERDAPRVRRARARWRSRQGEFAPDRLVFVDESGVNRSMTRPYARSLRGKRAFDHVPKNWGENLTIISALGLQGPLASMHLSGSTNGEAFLAYVAKVLVPTLPPKAIVVMDNLGAHRMAAVAAELAKAGAQLEYLPPYSHDFNPIEPAWSKLKSLLRSAAARTTPALHRAIAKALQSITPADAKAFFDHCGYGLPKR